MYFLLNKIVFSTSTKILNICKALYKFIFARKSALTARATAHEMPSVGQAIAPTAGECTKCIQIIIYIRRYTN